MAVVINHAGLTSAQIPPAVIALDAGTPFIELPMPAPTPGVAVLLPTSDTIRGGSTVIIGGQAFHDTSRNVEFTTSRIPSGWSTSGSVVALAGRGLELRDSTLVTPDDDYVFMDVRVRVAVDTGLVQVEHAGWVLRLDDTVASMPGDGVSATSIPASSVHELRFVRSGTYVYGLVDDVLVGTLLYDNMTTGDTVAVTGTRCIVQSFEVRSCAVVNHRLMTDIVVRDRRQLTGVVPAAPLAELGPGTLRAFGLFGHAEGPFTYTLPPPWTTGNEVSRTFRTYGDRVLKDD